MATLKLSESIPFPPERFVVEVFSDLPEQAVRERWNHLNVILRLSMLTGLQMQLDATLNLLGDMAAEIVSFEKALIYFWDEGREQMQLRIARAAGVAVSAPEELAASNVLNHWAVKHGRPLLVGKSHHPQADALLQAVGAGSAPAVPLFVHNRPIGPLPFFSPPVPTSATYHAHHP